MNSLPLSWTINNKSEFTNSIKKKNICWISHANLQGNNFFRTIDLQIINNPESDIIIRGCDSSIKNILEGKGFHSIKMGAEAVLETAGNCFNKKSIQKLVKRGLKKGKVIKLNYSTENAAKLNDFIKISTHSNEPQLKNLFQTEFRINHSLYVLVNMNEWLGAVLVSENSNSKIHTELILRKNDSPIGTLEAILNQIYIDAKQEDIKQLSLGEVPFSNSINLIKDGFYSTLITISGRFLKFAYNYKSLKKFKSKFNPKWQPVYICVSDKISLKHLIFLLTKSNFYSLIFFKLLYNLNYFSIHKKKFTNQQFFLKSLLDFNKT